MALRLNAAPVDMSRRIIVAIVLFLLACTAHAEQGLVAWYKFDEGSGTTANDSSGNGNTGTLMNGTTWTTGPRGGALNFDGVNDLVKIPRSASLDGTTGVTVAMWGNITDSRAGSYSDLLRKAAAYKDGYVFRWSFADSRLQLRHDHAPNASIVAKSSTSNSLLLNSWHHYAATYDSVTGTSVLYVDGIQAGTGTGTPSAINHTDDLYLMNVAYAQQVALPGKLNDVRIYNRVLSANEVAALVVVPPVAVADMFDTPPNRALTVIAPGVLANDSQFFNNALTAVKDSDPAHGTLVLNPNGSFTYTPANGYSGTDTFTYHANDGHSDSPVATVTITVTNIPPGLLLWYKFDEGAGLTATDSSGSGNTGTLVNGPQWTTGVSGGALNFDGVNDLVTFPNNIIMNNNTISILAWFKTTSSGALIGSQSYAYPSSSSLSHVPHIYVGTDGKLRGQYWTGVNAPITSTGTVNDGVWHHVALTGAINTQSLYLDGKLVGTLAGTISDAGQVYNQFGIGQGGVNWPGATGTFSIFVGALDDCRIYNRALSSAEISVISNSAPLAVADAYTVVTETQLVIAAPGVLANDSDINGDPLTAIPDSYVGNGTLSFNQDGSFSYTPNAGFTGTDFFVYHCNDGRGGNSTPVTITLNVVKAVPTVIWNSPANIVYGTALGDTQLNATASTPGTFTYTPSAGTILQAGNTQSLTVNFSPTDTGKYLSTSKSVVINVTKKQLTVTADNKTRTINLPNPVLTAGFSGFVNGDTESVLSGAPSLTTTAIEGSPAGSYAIKAGLGSLIAANYSFIFVDGTLFISNTPAFTNLSSPSIGYGSQSVTLSGHISLGATGYVTVSLNGNSQNATIDANGDFSAALDASALAIGQYIITYNYPGGSGLNVAADTRTLTVVKGTPAIHWDTPADITYGTLLSDTQLNATVDLDGTLTYDPPVNTKLDSGLQTLTVTFAPNDTAHYVNSSATVTLRVNQAVPTIDWLNPLDIVYGTALSAAQLNAVSNVPGTFNYNPPDGTVLDAGLMQSLTLEFVPDDSVNYITVNASILINVNKANQSINFAPIADTEFGTPPLTLNVTSSSGLPVALSVISGLATFNAGKLLLQGLGPVVVRAEQAGDNNYNPAKLDRTFNIVVYPPHLFGTLQANGTQGQTFSYMLTANGTQPITFESGTLPGGLLLDAVTGNISGTPSAHGAFQINITARNSAGTDSGVLTIVISGSGGGTNHAPQISSKPVAFPNPAVVGQTCLFTAAGTDEDGDSLAYNWDFGDSLSGTGATPIHTFTAAGIYKVKVIVNDGALSTESTILVAINATSSSGKAQVLKAVVSFGFAPKTLGKDSLSLAGLVPVTKNTPVSGTSVQINIGTLYRAYTLDKNGKSNNGELKFSGPSLKRGIFANSPASFTLAISKKALFDDLREFGFVNANVIKAEPVEMPVLITVNNINFLDTVIIQYKAKQDKSGSGKR